jgi:hypothetical protein
MTDGSARTSVGAAMTTVEPKSPLDDWDEFTFDRLKRET